MNTEIAALVYPIFRDRTSTPNKDRYYRFAIGSTVNSCPALPHGAAAQPDTITLFGYTVTSAQGLPVRHRLRFPWAAITGGDLKGPVLTVPNLTPDRWHRPVVGNYSMQWRNTLNQGGSTLTPTR